MYKWFTFRFLDKMKRAFKKSTKEEIEEMVKLYQSGVSYNEIGKRLGKDHSSIMYHIKKVKKVGIQGRTRQEQKRLDYPKEISKPEPEKIKILNPCKNCGGDITDKSWLRTNFCRLKCWDNKFTKNYVL